jgi:hypothetical protein
LEAVEQQLHLYFAQTSVAFEIKASEELPGEVTNRQIIELIAFVETN